MYVTALLNPSAHLAIDRRSSGVEQGQKKKRYWSWSREIALYNSINSLTRQLQLHNACESKDEQMDAVQPNEQRAPSQKRISQSDLVRLDERDHKPPRPEYEEDRM